MTEAHVHYLCALFPSTLCVSVLLCTRRRFFLCVRLLIDDILFCDLANFLIRCRPLASNGEYGAVHDKIKEQGSHKSYDKVKEKAMKTKTEMSREREKVAIIKYPTAVEREHERCDCIPLGCL